MQFLKSGRDGAIGKISIFSAFSLYNLTAFFHFKHPAV
jgi:hypothetical protein